MQRIETSLQGVFELRPVVHRDARGFFIETYHKAKFAHLGIVDDRGRHPSAQRRNLIWRRGRHRRIRTGR